MLPFVTTSAGSMVNIGMVELEHPPGSIMFNWNLFKGSEDLARQLMVKGNFHMVPGPSSRKDTLYWQTMVH